MESDDWVAIPDHFTRRIEVMNRKTGEFIGSFSELDTLEYRRKSANPGMSMQSAALYLANNMRRRNQHNSELLARDDTSHLAWI